MPKPPKCAFPGCPVAGRHEHHITYEPPVTKRLCVRHHEQITIINGQQARKYRRELSSSHRWWIWYQWIGGKLKARRTRKALEYIDEWHAYSPPKVEAATIVPPVPEKVSIMPAKRKQKAKRKKRGKLKNCSTTLTSKRRRKVR